MADKKPTEGLAPEARTILAYVQDSRTAKKKRMRMNQDNFDFYNNEQDWSHKTKGQSREFLPKQSGAVDQITSFLSQGLVDLDNWFDVEMTAEGSDSILTANDLYKLLKRQMKLAGELNFANDSLKSGLLGSVIICKVNGCYKMKPKWVVTKVESEAGPGVKLAKQERQYWHLSLQVVRQEAFHMDPTGKNLYRIEEVEYDYHDLLAMAGKDPNYDMEVIKSLQDNRDLEQEKKKARERNQDEVIDSFRKVIRLYECWGTIIDPNTKEVIKENGYCVITEQGRVVRKLTDNPYWHGEDPYVIGVICRVPGSVWHKALMDAGTLLNKAQNELFNLMLDGGFMAVHGIKQIRDNWLEDPSQVDNGIGPGDTLKVSASCPPGAKVLERVDTSTVPPDAFNVYGILDKEFMSSVLTNDVRMGGIPGRAVKATEVVASNQTLNGIFNGMTKSLEQEFFTEVIRKSLLTVAQNMDDLEFEEVKALIGPQKVAILKAMPPEERFAMVANGARVKVSGLTTIMNRINDFRKITTLLQTIGASPQMMNEFMQKYSITKLLGEIVKALDIKEEKIMQDPDEAQRIAQERAMAQQMAMAQAQGGKGGGGSPDGMSQVADPMAMADRTPQQEAQSEFQPSVAGPGTV